MANETTINHHQNCLPAQFCAIKLAKTPKLFKVNVHENIHWLNQQELDGCWNRPGGRRARRILMMRSFRLKLKQTVYTTYPICPDHEMVIVMFGPETILFLGSLSNFQCSERIRHVPPRGIWSYSGHRGLQGGVRVAWRGRVGPNLCRGGLYNRSQATSCLVYVKLKIHFIWAGGRIWDGRD